VRVTERARVMPGTVLSRPILLWFALWFVLCLAWTCAHVGLEAAAGLGSRKVGVPLALLSLALLPPLWRGWRWALPLAAVLGAVESYYVAAAHFVPGRNVGWIGPLPWLTTTDLGDTAWSSWALPYKLLIDLGLLAGLATLWAAARAARATFGRIGSLQFIAGATVILLLLGFSRWHIHDGLWGTEGLAWALGIGLVPGAVMVSACRGRAP